MKWNPQSSINLHELIDREDPKCLYCNSDVDLHQDGQSISTWAPATNTYEVQILTCRSCQETFEIHWYDHDGNVTYHAFVFTCQELLVFNAYQSHIDSSRFIISHKNGLYESWKDDPSKHPRYRDMIPPFSVDFSNKKSLYKKLKTYLVFS